MFSKIKKSVQLYLLWPWDYIGSIIASVVGTIIYQVVQETKTQQKY